MFKSIASISSKSSSTASFASNVSVFSSSNIWPNVLKNNKKTIGIKTGLIRWLTKWILLQTNLMSNQYKFIMNNLLETFYKI